MTLKRSGILRLISYFSDKGKITNKIAFPDDDEAMISDHKLTSEELSQFIQNITKGFYNTGNLVPIRWSKLIIRLK